MTHSKNTGDRWLRMALGVAAVTVLSGCYDDAVVDVTGEQPAVNVLVGPGAAVLPGGDLEVADLQILNPEGFDLSVPDAFARATGEELRRVEECPYDVDVECWIYMAEDLLDASEDPRQPALLEDQVGFGGGSNEWYNVLGPDFWGGAFYDHWAEFTGLPAAQTFYVGLARYGVEENGDVDQAEMLLTGNIDNPDQLVLAGGSPGGMGARPAGLFTDAPGWPYPAVDGANPWVWGFIESDVDGVALMDVMVSPFSATGEQIHYAGGEDGFDASLSPFGPNDLQTIGQNQYNYLVVWADDPTVTANPEVVARIQLAAEADGTSMEVLNNTFAPFPAGSTDPEGFSSLPGAGDAFVAPQTLNLTFDGLPALGSSGSYAVYLFNEETGSFAFLSTFESEGPTEVTELTFTQAGTELDFSEFNRVLVSIESGAPGQTPSNAGFLFREFLSSEFALSQGAFSVGTGNVTPAEQFEITGAGTGTFIRDSLLVQLRRLDAPPAGFHYQSFLLDGTPDNFSAEVRLHTIELDELGNTVDRIGEEEVGSFANFNTYVVALEPDVAPGLTPAFIQVSEDYIDQFGEDYFLDGSDDDDNGNGNGDT